MRLLDIEDFITPCSLEEAWVRYTWDSTQPPFSILSDDLNHLISTQEFDNQFATFMFFVPLWYYQDYPHFDMIKQIWYTLVSLHMNLGDLRNTQRDSWAYISDETKHQLRHKWKKLKREVIRYSAALINSGYNSSLLKTANIVQMREDGRQEVVCYPNFVFILRHLHKYRYVFKKDNQLLTDSEQMWSLCMSEGIASIHDLRNPNVDYAKQVDPLTDMIAAAATFHFPELIWPAEDDELYSSDEEEPPNTPSDIVWT